MEYRWDERHGDGLTDELDQLVYLSALVGSDPTLTQPGGGNSSIKRQENDWLGRSVEVLRVKGSGSDMASIGRGGFTGLRLGDLTALAQHGEMSDEQMMRFMRAAMLDPAEPGPSVETPLHSVLPFRCIVHTHDFATQALTDTPRPAETVREALGDEVAYVDYVRPGFPLAQAVALRGPMPSGARGLVLGRHGLIAWGDSARACYENLHLLINRAEAFIAGKMARGARPFAAATGTGLTAEERRQAARGVLPVVRAGLVARGRPLVLHHDDSAEALAFVGDDRASDLAARGMATPEHILRCGRRPLFVPADLTRLPPADAARLFGQALDQYAGAAEAAFDRHRPAAEGAIALPRVLLLPGLGVVTAMRDKANARLGNLCYRHVIRVMAAAEALGGFRFLDEADGLAFEYWPLELAKLRQPERELAGQVALVTGAAGGIGRAIAGRLLGEGAHLVLTDLDGEAVRAVGLALAASCKDPERIRAVAADATRPDETARAVAEAVLAFGGLDILVCNAGFIEAGPIDQIGEASWDRHFEVNVKGTFLAVREAVKVMKLQGRGVILLNASKGAFAPTADNAAYASSKAAVAALGRNLATELGPHGIRVNCLNADFVDTAMMRKLIEARAALRGITPAAQEEAYRQRNLLGVGPIPPAAVADAALFLVSSRSRFTTGAAFPIDGGIKEAMPR